MGKNISHCNSYDENKDYCIACDKGYGIAGKCKGFKCKSCMKCGENCKTCRKCICTECITGSINPLDPINCIDKRTKINDTSIDFSHFECSASMIKLNLFFILMILLLLKIKLH